jgi:hypothetical protein
MILKQYQGSRCVSSVSDTWFQVCGYAWSEWFTGFKNMTNKSLIAKNIKCYRDSDYYVPRRFRIAIVVSAEYTAEFGGTMEGALSAIATTISRVSGIFERDFGIELVLPEEQDLLVQMAVGTPLMSAEGSCSFGCCFGCCCFCCFLAA